MQSALVVSISDFILLTSQVGFKDSSKIKLCSCILAFVISVFGFGKAVDSM